VSAALLLLVGAAQAATVPEVRVGWDKHSIELRLQAPDGHHLADDFPASLRLSRTGAGWSGAAADLAAGVRLLRDGDVVSGIVEAAICEDASGTCARERLAFAGELSGRKGADLVLATQDAPREGESADVAHESSLDAALARAQAEGKRVLIDFTAVWCPPCNLLAAEVLRDPADAWLFEDIVLVEVDVDDFESWPVKDAYDVGGYPTLVLTDAGGAELDRIVGYPGEPAFTDWLQGASDRPALSRLPDVEALDGASAAALATRLCGVDRAPEAVPFLARAEAAGDTPVRALNTARVLVRGDRDAALWLARNAEPGPPWLWAAYGMAQGDRELADAMIPALQRAVPRADPALAADLLYAMAGLHAAHGRGDRAGALHAAAAATLGAALTGDPALDRGHWTFLAELRTQAGDMDGAVGLLLGAETQFPEEMTFPYALAGILLEDGDAHGAVEAAQRAAKVAYGDNALRVANRLAKAQVAAGDVPAARATLDAALKDAPAPGEAKVRTGRYLDALRETQEGLPAE
jgi:thiol-disulfide isomerase/thioredoxin